MTFLTAPIDTGASMLSIKTILIYFLSVSSITTTEVQINICDNFAVVASKLDLPKWHNDAAQSTQFIENTNLDFYQQGWVLKIEKQMAANEISVILKKNFPALTSEITTNKLSALKTAKCEYDLHGTDKKLACKMKNKISLRELNSILQTKSFKDLLSDDQKKWFKQENGIWPPDLQITADFTDQDYTQSLPLSTEEIVLGITCTQTGQEFIELSSRTLTTQAQSAQITLIQFLQSKNVRVCADQSSVHTLDKLKSFFGH